MKVDPESMPVLDQIQLFHCISEVIGIRGGALANILVMRPGPNVYECEYEVLMAPFYQDLAKFLKRNHAFIDCGNKLSIISESEK